MADILERIWGYLLNPATAEKIGKDLEWQGIIKTNKDVTIRYMSGYGKITYKLFKKNQEEIANYTHLSELVEKSLQEGPVEGLKKYGSKSKPRVKPPLKITIIKDSSGFGSNAKNEDSDTAIEIPNLD